MITRRGLLKLLPLAPTLPVVLQRVAAVPTPPQVWVRIQGPLASLLVPKPNHMNISIRGTGVKFHFTNQSVVKSGDAPRWLGYWTKGDKTVAWARYSPAEGLRAVRPLTWRERLTDWLQ